MDNPIAKKKVLQKVRRTFLTKGREDEDEDHQARKIPSQIDEAAIQLIDSSMGIIERNRKICVGVRFLNASINTIKVENRHACKAVTFSLKLNESIPKLPWEYVVKRLESYGDLTLATWAQKVRKYHSSYPKIMTQYSTLTQSEENPLFSVELRKIKKQIALAQQEIESTYPFKSVTHFSNGTTTVPVCATYSEGFLKEMDHSLEGFSDWVAENGVPKLFGGECPIHQDIAKAFLDCSVFQGDPVKYGSEYDTFFYDKNRVKRRAVIKLVLTVDPAPGGVLMTGYAIMKKNEVVRSNITEEFDLQSLKNFKEESVSEAVIRELDTESSQSR